MLKKRARLALLVTALVLCLSGCDTYNRARQKLVNFTTDFLSQATVTVPVFVTSTPTSTATLTSTPTLTPTPTETPTPTPISMIQNSPTFEVVKTEELLFSLVDEISDINDVTIPDDTVLAPGQIFIKSWRMTNSGADTWLEGTKLIMEADYEMDTPSVVNAIFTRENDWPDFTPGGWGTRAYNVAPGTEVDLVVMLKAPEEPGSYEIDFRLLNTNGEVIVTPFWINFKVEEPTPTPEVASTEEAGQTATFDWSGRWMIREPLRSEGVDPANAWFYQNGQDVIGFWYDASGDPVIVTGTTSGSGRVFTGKFFYPWQQDTFNVQWRMQISKNQFYAVTEGGKLTETAICGGRNGQNYPATCALPSGA